MVARVILPLLFVAGGLALGGWVLVHLRDAELRERERDRRRPDNPSDEYWSPHCPSCGEPYISWSYVPAVVARGEVIRGAHHTLRCANGHRWP